MHRLGMEIENNPLSFSFTLTYSNDFLPYLVKGPGKDGNIHWISDHPNNFRHDGTKVVTRSFKYEYFELDAKYPAIPVTNFYRNDVIAYASKRDIQLYLKNIRKTLYERFDDSYNLPYRIRYAVFNEYGEDKFRPHYHCIFFFPTKEVADFTIQCALYQAWQMCNKSRLFAKSKYCDSGASRYLTAYFNSITVLPYVYKTDLKPFRLCSKAPAIGYSSFIPSLFEKASIGDITYNRTISDPSKQSVFLYSSDFIRTQFPKCKGFDNYTFHGLCRLYGALYYAERRWYLEPDAVSRLLSENLPSQDYQCIRKCYQFSKEFGKKFLGDPVKHYVYMLDLVYYKQAMNSLKLMYEWQMKQPKLSIEILGCYQNLPQKVAVYTPGDFYLDWFLAPFGLVPGDIQDLKYSEWMPKPVEPEYIDELNVIRENMVKMPKLREDIGSSPVHCFT